MISRKADLSLSTNAIVVLILAITILGLALVFVRGLFSKSETLVEGATQLDTPNPPTRDIPLTLSPSKMTVRQKEQKQVILAYLNKGPTDQFCKIVVLRPDGKKINDTAAMVAPNPTDKLQDLAKYDFDYTSLIEANTIITKRIIIDGAKAKDNTNNPTTGTYLLTVAVCCSDPGASGNHDSRLQYINTLPAPNTREGIYISPYVSPRPAAFVCRNTGASGSIKRYLKTSELIVDVVQ
ncbi:hypothetical protein HYU10_04375 [Candidatus Woesearchaeota archaeon]|nr:hypothetical protein [Candidatus Woesearchaeota archaeon]